MLNTYDLVKIYKKRKVVDRVTISVKPGEVVGLLGPNGAGKTTSFYMIAGIVKPESGQVFFNEVDVSQMSIHKRATLGIGYLPQQPSIFKKLSVADNVMIILETLPISKQERLKRLDYFLKYLNINHLSKNLACTLSGGERRRLEITRILVTSPKIILLDEPFAGVDPLSVIEVQKIITQLKETGYGILLTDHNVRETLSITDRTYLLYEGRVMKEGASEFLANDPEAKKLYLGENFKL